jgi:hypothetical protein
MFVRRTVGLALIAGVVTVAVPAANAAPKGKARLRLFHSCPELVAYARKYAPEQIGGGAVLNRDVAFASPVTNTTGPARGQLAPTASGQDASQPADSSQTNVQEAGVDEPDSVKSNGKTIFALANGVLNAVDARAATPVVLDTLAVTGGGELFIHGDRALVMTNNFGYYGGGPRPLGAAALAPAIYPIGRGKTTLTEVDISNPRNLRVVQTLIVDGSYVSARLTGRTARVVITTPPQAFELPTTNQPQTPAQEQARYRRAIRTAGIARWRPRATLRVLRGRHKTSTRAAVACNHIARPAQFSGADMLTVLTIDMDKGLPAVDSDALMTDAQTVYASKTSLYLATERWVDPRLAAADLPAGQSTTIHRFESGQPDTTTYAGSGSVPGFILNQFSLSDYNGFLRVATTDAPQWVADAPPAERQSHVTVLDQQNGQLVQVGKVSGLGKGERIYAVRFLDDRGYVVTFRQVDPLYVLDLSNPKAPSVSGELKLFGYSAYLHPVGKDLLLGVGQDATEQGRLQGAQLSLFDVGNPAAPRRLAQHLIAKGSNSTVEYDHRAFLWWPANALAVLPVNVFNPDNSSFTGAIGFSVTKAKGISELGRLTQPSPGAGYTPTIDRTFVVGKRIFSVSAQGIGVNDLDTLAAQGFVKFPDAPVVTGGDTGTGTVVSPSPPTR